jgi:hypothetical protein
VGRGADALAPAAGPCRLLRFPSSAPPRATPLLSYPCLLPHPSPPSYVNGNYEWVALVAGLGPDELAALAVNSFEASFLPAERKAAYAAEVARTLGEWKQEQLRSEQN